MNGRRRWAAALSAALPAILLAAAFWRPLTGQLFYLRDIVQNHQPMRMLVTQRLVAGSLPLWDPFHGGGTPLLANPDNLVFHPITLLFFVLPFDVAFTASILAQFAVLAWGGFLLARRCGAGVEGATLASVVLSLSGPAASLASMQNVLGGFAWVPLALWALLRGLEPARRAWLALAAVLLAVVLASGEAASILAVLLLAPTLVLAETPEGGSSSRARLRRLTCLAGVLAGAALIAAAQVLPARALLPLASRGSGLPFADALKWSLQPVRLWEVLLPGLFGDPTRLSPAGWWGAWVFEGGYPFLLTVYIGAIPCLLACVALENGRRRNDRERLLWLVAIGGLLLALGSHAALYRLAFRGLAIVRQVRYPERFLLITLLALALLAASGLDRLREGSPELRRRRAAWLTGAAIVVFLLATVMVIDPGLADRFLAGAVAVPVSVLGSDDGAVQRGTLLRSLLWGFGEAAVLAGAALLAAARPTQTAGGRRGLRAAVWGVVAVSGASLLLAAAPARSAADPGWLRSPSPLAGTLPTGAGAPRLHHAPRPRGLSVWARSDELVWGYRFDRFTYALATGRPDGIPTLFDAATDRMDLAPSSDIGRRMQDRSLDDRLRLLSIGHAGFLLTHEALIHPGIEAGPVLEGFSRPAARLYRLRDILPRARFVARGVPPSHPGDALTSLLDEGFDPRREVILEELPVRASGEGPAAPRDDPGPPGAPAPAVTVGGTSPEEVVLTVDAPASGYVVLSDAFAPGWRARLDGRPAPVLRANMLFRAVAVGPGRHTIIMTYRPAAVTAGLILSLLGLCGAAVFAVMSVRGSR